MNIEALIAFNAANELADDMYEHQQRGIDFNQSIIDEYTKHASKFEELTGDSFGEKRQEYLELTA